MDETIMKLKLERFFQTLNQDLHMNLRFFTPEEQQQLTLSFAEMKALVEHGDENRLATIYEIIQTKISPLQGARTAGIVTHFASPETKDNRIIGQKDMEEEVKETKPALWFDNIVRDLSEQIEVVTQDTKEDTEKT